MLFRKLLCTSAVWVRALQTQASCQESCLQLCCSHSWAVSPALPGSRDVGGSWSCTTLCPVVITAHPACRLLGIPLLNECRWCGFPCQCVTPLCFKPECFWSIGSGLAVSITAAVSSAGGRVGKSLKLIQKKACIDSAFPVYVMWELSGCQQFCSFWTSSSKRDFWFLLQLKCFHWFLLVPPEK